MKAEEGQDCHDHHDKADEIDDAVHVILHSSGSSRAQEAQLASNRRPPVKFH
jgi:hypothetical protein